MRRRNALRWTFAGVTLAFLSWAGADEMLAEFVEGLGWYPVSDLLFEAAEARVPLILGGLAAIFGAYLFISSGISKQDN